MKTKSTNVAVSTSSAIFGTAHFIFDTLSDIALSAEANLNHKLRGDEKEITKLNRQIKTEITKLNIKKHVLRQDTQPHTEQSIVDAFSKIAKKNMAEQQARIIIKLNESKVDITESAMEMHENKTLETIKEINELNNI